MRIFHKLEIKVYDEEDPVANQSAPVTQSVKTTAKCDPDKVYIITGGLGGCGLELASWLVDKGAKKLVLVSRSAIKNGYQARKVRLLRGQIELCLLKENIIYESSCRDVIEKATRRGPVGGIFHLAMVS
jgi:fatty acid synthase